MVIVNLMIRMCACCTVTAGVIPTVAPVVATQVLAHVPSGGPQPVEYIQPATYGTTINALVSIGNAETHLFKY